MKTIKDLNFILESCFQIITKQTLSLDSDPDIAVGIFCNHGNGIANRLITEKAQMILVLESTNKDRHLYLSIFFLRYPDKE